ncbi:cytochrome c [Paenibacillus sp. GSMTC-2017]|uniref:c-type cytochrome n=1 Tax=Paenibacillus sp. GSMTC-2017 TaxID=2794350 RepID=UPI0018D637AE|nr:cytochrome c [Paenibacillus sp. GSMTC-2017]MBH5319900.1 cytochrome c [Paenibacillus sp. GSMTC-2017]
MRNIKWVLLLALVALVISLSACGGGKGATNNETDKSNNTNNGAGETVNAAEAEKLYKQSCVTCHAVDLGGGVGPNLQKVGGKLSLAEIRAKIVNGGNGMPPYKEQLTGEQIDTLANWLATKK